MGPAPSARDWLCLVIAGRSVRWVSTTSTLNKCSQILKSWNFNQRILGYQSEGRSVLWKETQTCCKTHAKILARRPGLLGRGSVLAKPKSRWDLSLLLPGGTIGLAGAGRCPCPWFGHKRQAFPQTVWGSWKGVCTAGEGGRSLTRFFQGAGFCRNLFQNFSIGHILWGGSTGSRGLSSWSFSHRLLSSRSCCSRSFSSGVYPVMSPRVPRRKETARPRTWDRSLPRAPAGQSDLARTPGSGAPLWRHSGLQRLQSPRTSWACAKPAPTALGSVGPENLGEDGRSALVMG